MQRAFIVHGWRGHPLDGWFPWLRAELEREGFSVQVPLMRSPYLPTRETWVPALRAHIGTPTDETYLVGYSLGCITVLRYLESLGVQHRVGGVVLIAGFTDDLGYAELLESYFPYPLAWEHVRARSLNGFIAISSDNDQYVPLTHADVFRQQLHATLIVLHGMRHFEESTGIREFPEARDAVLRLAGFSR
ncbi:MAG: alpha/beta hydrolase [bacterium]|nr:alpha/beta hydrolase [bacterium]